MTVERFQENEFTDYQKAEPYMDGIIFYIESIIFNVFFSIYLFNYYIIYFFYFLFFLGGGGGNNNSQGYFSG